MWETTDPDGRAVVLTDERWEHVRLQHPNLDVEPAVLLNAVARPSRRLRGRRPSEEWFYRRGVGPTDWMRVVVHYEGDRGLIVTAFPRRWYP
jgi:hypothetical protein